MAIAVALRAIIGRCEWGCDGPCPYKIVIAARERKLGWTPRLREVVEKVLDKLWRLPQKPRRFIWDVLYGKEHRPTTSCLTNAQLLADRQGMHWNDLSEREATVVKDLRFMYNPTMVELIDAALNDDHIDEATARELSEYKVHSEVIENLTTYFTMADLDFEEWLEKRKFAI